MPDKLLCTFYFHNSLAPSYFFRSEFKDCNSVCRQIVCKRVFSSVTFTLHCLVYNRTLRCISAKFCCISIQHEAILFSFWYTDAIIRSCYRCKVDHKEQIALTVFGMTHKAENASVGIICIDPFKSAWILICIIKCRCLFIEMKQCLDVILHLLMFVFCKQIPVKFSCFAPLLKLCKLLSHKQQFFSRMTKHVCIAGT